MAFSIMTLSKVTLSTVTLSIITFNINGLIAVLSMMPPSIITFSIITHCHYAKYRILFIVTLNVIMPSVVMLNVIQVGVKVPFVAHLTTHVLCKMFKTLHKAFKAFSNNVAYPSGAHICAVAGLLAIHRQCA